MFLRRAVLDGLAHAGASAAAFGAGVVAVAAPAIVVLIAPIVGRTIVVIVEAGLVLVALHAAIAAN